MGISYSTNIAESNSVINEFLMPQGPDYKYIPCSSFEWNIDIFNTNDMDFFPQDHSKWFLQVVRDCYKDGMVFTPRTDIGLNINRIKDDDCDDYKEGISIDIKFSPKETERFSKYSEVKFVLGWGDNLDRHYFFWQNLIKHQNSI